jgi:hypothetical protein
MIQINCVHRITVIDALALFHANVRCFRPYA